MNSKKRIVFILGSMGRGGAERVVSIISNHYANKDWDVDIILLLDSKCEYNLNNKIKIISLANKNKSRISQLPNWILGIRSYLKKYKPNTVLSFAARINIISAIANIGIKNHFIVSERNDPNKDGRSMWVKIGTYLLYPHVNKVVFQTKQAQSYFNEKIILNSDIIYNPVNIDVKYKSINSKKIVAVGRLEPQKNHKLLIASFKEVIDMFPEYSLIIYGEGTLRKELEGIISELGMMDKVSLPGNIKNIHQKLLEAEFFVLSSDYEGLSNALLEAMMMGLPCISTDCAGSNEVITSGENGILVPVGNKDSLVDAMKLLIKNREFALSLGKQAEETSNQFSSTNIIRKWESVLE